MACIKWTIGTIVAIIASSREGQHPPPDPYDPPSHSHDAYEEHYPPPTPLRSHEMYGDSWRFPPPREREPPQVEW